jgi:hypothetical protein
MIPPLPASTLPREHAFDQIPVPVLKLLAAHPAPPTSLILRLGNLMRHSLVN